ncbi:hypothetical protein P7C73_g6716, partial [Tremellales sp. Uapishka_1]
MQPTQVELEATQILTEMERNVPAITSALTESNSTTTVSGVSANRQLRRVRPASPSPASVVEASTPRGPVHGTSADLQVGQDVLSLLPFPPASLASGSTDLNSAVSANRQLTRNKPPSAAPTEISQHGSLSALDADGTHSIRPAGLAPPAVHSGSKSTGSLPIHRQLKRLSGARTTSPSRGTGSTSSTSGKTGASAAVPSYDPETYTDPPQHALPTPESPVIALAKPVSEVSARSSARRSLQATNPTAGPSRNPSSRAKRPTSRYTPEVENQGSSNDGRRKEKRAETSGTPAVEPMELDPLSSEGEERGAEMSMDTASAQFIPNAGGKRKRSNSPIRYKEDDRPDSPTPEPLDESFRPAFKVPKIKETKGKGKAKRSVKAERASRGFRTRTSTPAVPTPPAVSTVNPLRVLAYWGGAGQGYYPGTLSSMQGDLLSVRFDDGSYKNTTLEKVRLLVLRPGEVVKIADGDEAMLRKEVVVEDDMKEGDRQLRVRYEGKSLTIDIGVIYISVANIAKRFEDRKITADVLRLNHLPSPQVNVVNKSAASSNVFVGKVFIISAGTVKNGEADRLELAITNNGGSVQEGWEGLFDTQSRLKLKDTPFVVCLGSEVVFSAKGMVSLAAGIPCLSPMYIYDSLQRNQIIDWRSYLVSPGKSIYLENTASQMVDPNWGSDNWIAGEARAIRRPFVGMSFLFVLHGAKKIKDLVPFCIRALGSDDLEEVHNVDRKTRLEGYDYIVVEDRKVPIPQVLSGHPRLCNVPWLKQCLIMGAALPPSITPEVKPGQVENGTSEAKR